MHDGEVTVYSAGEGMGSSCTVEIGMQRKALKGLVVSPNARYLPPEIPPHGTHEKDINCGNEKGMEESFYPSLSWSKYTHTMDSFSSENEFSRINGHISEKVIDNFKSLSPEPIFKVLIVDDSNLNRKMLRKIFHASGQVVEELEVWCNQGFTLIVTLS
jgi:CheY-like chemotaxis protein